MRRTAAPATTGARIPEGTSSTDGLRSSAGGRAGRPPPRPIAIRSARTAGPHNDRPPSPAGTTADAAPRKTRPSRQTNLESRVPHREGPIRPRGTLGPPQRIRGPATGEGSRRRGTRRTGRWPHPTMTRYEQPSDPPYARAAARTETTPSRTRSRSRSRGVQGPTGRPGR